MAQWAKDICDEQWKMVKVTYRRYDKGSVYGGHLVFGAESLSRPGMSHSVYIQTTPRYAMMDENVRRGLTPQDLIHNHLVRVWSSDEFYKFGGCQYNQTVMGNALIPEFRQPKPEHDYEVSHSLWAVLAAFLESEGADRENFSRVMVFDNGEYI